MKVSYWLFMHWIWFPLRQKLHLLHGLDGDTETNCPIDKFSTFEPIFEIYDYIWNLLPDPDVKVFNDKTEIATDDFNGIGIFEHFEHIGSNFPKTKQNYQSQSKFRNY